MRERPAGSELLAVAERTLREEVLPALADEKKYLVLMVLKALSIAQRQLVLDDLDDECSQMRALLQDVHTSVGPLEREFGRRVREGTFDHDHAAQRALWDLTIRRVRESAPRHLESEGLE